MSLDVYFTALIEQVEASDIQNNGKDENGFFSPTRTLLLRHLNLLRELHNKPHAKEMVKSAWVFVVAHVPQEWLTLSPAQKVEMKKILSEN